MLGSKTSLATDWDCIHWALLEYVLEYVPWYEYSSIAIHSVLSCDAVVLSSINFAVRYEVDPERSQNLERCRTHVYVRTREHSVLVRTRVLEHSSTIE